MTLNNKTTENLLKNKDIKCYRKFPAILCVIKFTAKSLPLVAHASGSHTLTLPNNSLVLRGSVSNSGTANVSFLWVRDEQSPAAGVSEIFGFLSIP